MQEALEKFLEEKINPRYRRFLFNNCDHDTDDTILLNLESLGLATPEDIDFYFRTKPVNRDDKVIEESLARRYDVLITSASNEVTNVYYSVFNNKSMEELRFELSSRMQNTLIDLIPCTPFRIRGMGRIDPTLKFKRLVLEADMRDASDVYLSIHPIYGSDGITPDYSCRISMQKFPLESINITPEDINLMIVNVIRSMTNRGEFDLDTNYGLEVDVQDPLGDGQLLLRMSSMKTRWGYKAAFRIHREAGEIRSLPNLGFSSNIVKVLSDLTHKRMGLSIIAGAMGNGKTNTINAIIELLCKLNLEIVEVSNPPENRLPISQIGYDGDLDKLYNTISLLRKQALDVAMIGEINNRKVAKATIDLVTSSVHVLTSLHLSRTYHLPNKLKSFLDEEYKDVFSQLNICVTQMLVPMMCPHCKSNISLESVPDKIRELMVKYDYPIYHYFEPRGCENCEGKAPKLIPFAEYVEFTSEVTENLMSMENPFDMQVYLKNLMFENKTLFEFQLLDAVSNGIIHVSHLNKIL